VVNSLIITRSLPACLLLLLFLATSASAVDPSKHISQYSHTAWRIQDGIFSGAPNAIAQTSDGYIWIGTQTGLVRFDGVRFVPWTTPEGKQLSNVFSLLAESDGSLWIGTATNLAQLKDGNLTNFLDAPGRVNAIIHDRYGTVWFTRSRVRDARGPLCQVVDTKIRCYGKPDGIMTPYAGPLTIDSTGNFWIGSSGALTRFGAASTSSYTPAALKSSEGLSGVQALVALPDGSLLIGVNPAGPGRGLQQVVQEIWKPFATPELDGSTLDVSAMFLDREGTLWIGSDSQGIYRLHEGKVEHFRGADGLSGDTVTGFYEDREGNLWAATSEGLDCFRNARVISFSTREGLKRNTVTSILAGRDGTVWIGNNALEVLQGDTLSSLPPTTLLPGKHVTSLLEDHAGRLWVGVDDGLWVYESGRYRRVPGRDGTPIGIIIAMTEDRDNNIWVERIGPPRGLIRIQDFAVQEEFPESQIPFAYSLATDPQDGIWLGLGGDLARYRQGKLESFSFKRDQNSRVRQIIVRSDGSVVGATPQGLIGWWNGTQRTMTVKNGLPCDAVFGLVEDAQGALWLYRECGLMQIEKTQLEDWWELPEAIIKTKVFDTFDGTRPAAVPFQPAASRGPDGRLWFANENIVQMIDPAHLAGNALPPAVHIEKVVADRQSYLSLADLRLPPRTRDLEIDYTALSFVTPQKVRFRYKLEGRDPDWQEAGTRRQAFYSDLRPGAYRFRVMACNNDGVWNETGATVGFSIAPAWYQTRLFRALLIATVFFIAWLLYRLHVRRIAHDLSLRFDERLAERTRLARELHDTFLQTIQGSKLVADDALEQNGDPARLRRAMEQLSIWLGQAVNEGRAALNSLRSSTTEQNDLAAALQRATETSANEGSMTPTFSVIGEAKDMHPIVRDEIYRIGYEAIHNACMHSKASRLEIELKYDQDLVIRVKDNGKGIDAQVAEEGKDGHFGLTGMRERAARIGAKFTLATSPTSGTEITLVVPGDIAFHPVATVRGSSLPG
jgi:signal transduction histidine kinase/ligand-binding sensor domain-containing protein